MMEHEVYSVNVPERAAVSFLFAKRNFRRASFTPAGISTVLVDCD